MVRGMEAIFEDNFITSADMLEEVDDDSPIKDFLRDKTVFITGRLEVAAAASIQ